jgi:hypothetical protein
MAAPLRVAPAARAIMAPAMPIVIMITMTSPSFITSF